MPELKLNHDLHDTRDADLVSGSKLLGEAQYNTVNFIRSNFSRVIDKSSNEHTKILITEHKRPTAAVVPVSDLRVLMLLERMGISSQLSELTYKDISIDEAIEALQQMSSSAGKSAADEAPKMERREDGEDRRGGLPKPMAA